MKKPLIFLLLSILGLCAQEYYRGGKKVMLTPIEASTSLTARMPGAQKEAEVVWYRNEQGKTIGVKQELLITWHKGADRTTILAGYPIVKIKNLTSSITLISLSSGSDVFVLAEQLYLHEQIRSAHPNMTQERERR